MAAIGNGSGDESGGDDSGESGGNGDDSGGNEGGGAIEVPCTGITLSATTLTFTAKGTHTLTANVTPNGCTDVVNWVSNNPNVAIVVDGRVTTVDNGDAVITITVANNNADARSADVKIVSTLNELSSPIYKFSQVASE